MIVDDLFENVAGPEKCWPGYRKVGTKPGTGGNTGKRVNDCEKIRESSGDFGIGDPVIITGDVEFRGKTGDVREFDRDGAFVVVNLYNYGPYSFHTSDVSYNDYADAEDEEDVAEGNDHSLKKVWDRYSKHLMAARGDHPDIRQINKSGAIVRNIRKYVKDHHGQKAVDDMERYAEKQQWNEGMAEDSLEEINFQNRSTSNSGTGELRGVNIPSTMRHPGWKEPTWSFQEIAQKLGISTSALNLLAFKSIGGFPEAVPGLASRYGSKKYYKQSEVKRWVNTNNVREKLKQGVAEGSFGSGYGSVFTLYVNTGEKPATKTKTKKFKREDDAVLWAEDYADRHDMFPNLKMEIQDENGNVVWELEESQGVAEGEGGFDIEDMVMDQYRNGNDVWEIAQYLGIGEDEVQDIIDSNEQGVAEADAEKIGDRYDPEEFDDMMLRLKTLAGAGPLKTVWDPVKRVYRNVPINQPQDKK